MKHFYSRIKGTGGGKSCKGGKQVTKLSQLLLATLKQVLLLIGGSDNKVTLECTKILKPHL